MTEVLEASSNILNSLAEQRFSVTFLFVLIWLSSSRGDIISRFVQHDPFTLQNIRDLKGVY